MDCCTYMQTANECEDIETAMTGFQNGEVSTLNSNSTSIVSLLTSLGDNLGATFTPDNLGDCVAKLPELYQWATDYIAAIDADVGFAIECSRAHYEFNFNSHTEYHKSEND